QVFACAGHDVRVYDPLADSLATVHQRIRANLVDLGRDTSSLTHVTTHDSLSDAVAPADIVVEAGPEKLPLKQNIFADLVRLSRPDAILASNTSVIPIGQIAGGLETAARIIGTHWWNPPFLVPLVEVVSTDRSDPAVAQRMIDILTEIGKTPVHVKK